MKAFIADVKRRIIGTPIVDIDDLQRISEQEGDSSNELNVTAQVLTYQVRIYIPNDGFLCNTVISIIHDNPESSHFKALKTAKLVS